MFKYTLCNRIKYTLQPLNFRLNICYLSLNSIIYRNINHVRLHFTIYFVKIYNCTVVCLDTNIHSRTWLTGNGGVFPKNDKNPTLNLFFFSNHFLFFKKRYNLFFMRGHTYIPIPTNNMVRKYELSTTTILIRTRTIKLIG
jgi:hypothetical protein